MRYGQAIADPSCKALINTVYRNGRTGFYFTAEGSMLTFSGIEPQINQGTDDILQPVDLILVTQMTADEPGQPEPRHLISAKSTCELLCELDRGTAASGPC